MGQEFRADGATERECETGREQQEPDSNRHDPVTNRQSQRVTISPRERLEYRVAPFARSVPVDIAGQHWNQEHRKQQRSKERKCHRPRHRPEQAPLDPLQGEDRHIRGDDDGDRVEDWPRDLARRAPNAVLGGEILRIWEAQEAKDVLDHHDRAVHDHPEIERAERQQVCRDVAKVEQNRREQQ